MTTLDATHLRVKPGVPVLRPPGSRRPAEPEQLAGADRRAFEESLKARPGLKGRSMLALLTLLDIHRGKAWSYPSDAYIAGKAGVSENTAWRAVRDLVGLGIIRTVRARGRRWIVLVDHPAAAEFLEGLGVEPAPQPEIAATQVEAAAPQVGGRSVVVKPRDESPVAVPPRVNENDRTPEAEPVSFNWRAMVAGQGGTVPPVPEKPKSAGRPAAPVDPAERAAIVAAALGEGKLLTPCGEGHGVSQTPAAPATGGLRVAPTHRPPAVQENQSPSATHRQPVVQEIPVDLERATIEALSKLGPGARPGEVLAATARLTALFSDPGSRAYYRSVCTEVARGQLPARVLVAAVSSARGPGIRRPGAAFAAHVKRVKAAVDACRPMRA